MPAFSNPRDMRTVEILSGASGFFQAVGPVRCSVIVSGCWASALAPTCLPATSAIRIFMTGRSRVRTTRAPAQNRMEPTVHLPVCLVGQVDVRRVIGAKIGVLHCELPG